MKKALVFAFMVFLILSQNSFAFADSTNTLSFSRSTSTSSAIYLDQDRCQFSNRTLSIITPARPSGSETEWLECGIQSNNFSLAGVSTITIDFNVEIPAPSENYTLSDMYISTPAGDAGHDFNTSANWGTDPSGNWITRGHNVISFDATNLQSTQAPFLFYLSFAPIWQNYDGQGIELTINSIKADGVVVY